MPRASFGERRARDALVFSLFVAGKPYRHIDQHSAVQLSVRGVQIAVRRHVAASGGVERSGPCSVTETSGRARVTQARESSAGVCSRCLVGYRI